MFCCGRILKLPLQNKINLQVLFMKFLKRLLKFFVILIGSFAGILLLFYFMAPVYQFSGPVPFKGEKLYNPYEGMDSTHWRKYNFQVQSHVWGGITNGRKNSNRLIDSVYKVLGYDYVATSDYQSINYHGKNSPRFIPTYEHGYNVFKTHQVCIGSDEVLWVELFLFQSTGMKQWIIDKLRPHNQIVALAHPKLRNGYTFDDLKKLTHYDLMEVLNNFRISSARWDTALSAGQKVFILANDDAHDVMNPVEVGTRFTMINSPTTNKDDIITALKSGNAYGVDFKLTENETLAQKAAREKKLPLITGFTLNGDTITVSIERMVKTVRFIRQGGEVVKEINQNKAKYAVKPDDRYIRTEIDLEDGTRYYLNPVIRYSGDKPESKLTAKPDVTATGWLRIFYFAVVATTFWYFTRKLPGKNHEKRV